MVRTRRFQRPVIILGAPRSGTSLMHRILRGLPGSVSTARESGEIWGPRTHPEHFEWRGEMAPGAVPEEEVAQIHRELARAALPAALWRRADASDVSARQREGGRIARLAAPAYRAVVRARGQLWRSTLKRRLVDKSVHNGLWTELLERCFPDARFVHIVREPEATLASMRDGWLDPDRFFTYKVPGGLGIPDYPHQHWNFPLPEGWESVRDAPLAVVVAFQWRRIQEGILGLESRVPRERFLRVRLEDLSMEPRRVLGEVAQFLNLEDGEGLRRYADGLPVVNARPTECVQSGAGNPPIPADVLANLVPLAERLGYSEAGA
ncbi:sulfotransferase [Thioalkalivibrio sp. ALE11]|uniref:sulfotransferase family protein n=1 Tax=Thioalkalivibrio sp. ALE11 TaxID=1265494 RepID=UPI0009D9F27E|nr:sulfotransferase [Thioalkalivibrio sp. ALE11]